MKFNGSVVEHRPFGIPMIGNVSNGYAIGLTEEGHRLCQRMFAEEVPEAAVAAVSEELLAHLKRGGFCDEPVPESVHSGARGAACEEALPLQSAYLHVTHRCNLHCIGCYSHVENRNARADLPLGDVRLLIDRLAAAGVQRLIISGGEPFLRADLPAVVEHAKTAGIAFVDVLTNGTAVGDEALRRLAPFVDRIAVSFDGVAPDADARIRHAPLFDQLVDTVRRIREAGIAAHIIPTLHGGNAGDVEAYCALAESLGATVNFSLLSAPPTEEAREVLPDEKALEALARAMLDAGRTRQVSIADTPVNTGVATTAGCGAGCSLVSVSAEGEVYPCHMLHDPAFKVGSLLEGEECLHRRRKPASPVSELPVCRECEIRYLCGGGCRARAFFATGDIRARDPYCTLMKTYYQLLFQAMADH